MKQHYAMIGMAHVADDYPLYYDAINEKGLGMAGLNFVGNAVYGEPVLGKKKELRRITWHSLSCRSGFWASVPR